MPRYDMHCNTCDTTVERFCPADDRHSQRCEKCESPLTIWILTAPRGQVFARELNGQKFTTKQSYREHLQRNNLLDPTFSDAPPKKTSKDMTEESIAKRFKENYRKATTIEVR